MKPIDRARHSAGAWTRALCIAAGLVALLGVGGIVYVNEERRATLAQFEGQSARNLVRFQCRWQCVDSRWFRPFRHFLSADIVYVGHQPSVQEGRLRDLCVAFPEIRYMDLCYVDLGTGDIEAISRLSLQGLAVRGGTQPDECLKCLANSHFLRSLRFDSADAFTGSGLAYVPYPERLRVLDLVMCTGVTSEGFANIARFREIEALGLMLANQEEEVETWNLSQMFPRLRKLSTDMESLTVDPGVVVRREDLSFVGYSPENLARWRAEDADCDPSR